MRCSPDSIAERAATVGAHRPWDPLGQETMLGF